MTARVVIADDHVPTRLAIRTALEEGGFQVVAEASTAASAVDRVRDQRPDVALLDINMPGGGLHAARAITAFVDDDTAVVMLTVSRNDADLFEALQAGARGYLLKGIDPARLPLALRGVLDGEAALPRSLVARLVEEFRVRGEPGRPTTGPFAALTVREWAVLELLQEGLTTKQIAERLFVSTGTVRTHVAAVVHKLRVPDREAAARFAPADRSRPARGGC